MAAGVRHLIEGAAAVVVGLALWLFTGGVETPVITLKKVGVAVMCFGAVQMMVGTWTTARQRR
ncbi:DUF5708 family protein [Streptomyces zagrosensis]|uniref:Ribosomal protein S12 methylthiotransferase accessory factor YcaO n=1 Tax=Streptomyces zagrosensis TaxID=1042984 RepID=A0A7W9Q4B8_9ACTN|nr:DUF5708 family protein [Streptomyces zagrosensis]MBB5933295.1 ribosomal protein S12 methylthiotransferase accessory factor YcaO [Streptomyces zagrosensis]